MESCKLLCSQTKGCYSFQFSSGIDPGSEKCEIYKYPGPTLKIDSTFDYYIAGFSE